MACSSKKTLSLAGVIAWKPALPKPLIQENLDYGEQEKSICPHDPDRAVARTLPGSRQLPASSSLAMDG
jgi:hypothetical protein